MRWILVALFVVSGFAHAAGIGDLMDQAREVTGSSPTGMLGQQFDVDETQVEGGLGSILSMAQTRLKSGEFDQLISAIPGGQGYMDTAKQLGLLDLPLENVDSVISALTGAGWSADAAADFVPAAINALGNVGGAEIQQMLAPLLGGG